MKALGLLFFGWVCGLFFWMLGALGVAIFWEVLSGYRPVAKVFVGIALLCFGLGGLFAGPALGLWGVWSLVEQYPEDKVWVLGGFFALPAVLALVMLGARGNGQT